MTASTKPKNDKQRRKRWTRRLLAAAIFLALVALAVFAAIPKPEAVDEATVHRGRLSITVDEAGKVRVRDRYVVSAAFAGNVSRIELRAGDAIEAGGPLATIVPAEPPLLDARTRATAEARVASAMAVHRQSDATASTAAVALENAKNELGNVQKLAQSGTLSPEALERAQLEVRLREQELASAHFASQVAASEIATARAALGLLDPGASRRLDAIVVPSPVKGRVLRVLHADAGVVAPGTPLVEVGDPTALEFVVDVLTADAVRIKPGAKTMLEAWGGPPLAAHVRRVEPSAFTRISALGVEEQRVSVVVDLDAPREEWAALGDGWRAEARVLVWQKDDALVAPGGAVFRKGDGWAAYVDQGGRAVTRVVRVGERSATDVEITDGLAEGDRVLVHPSERITDGVRIASR
jgi:HlyD family secretion protein